MNKRLDVRMTLLIVSTNSLCAVFARDLLSALLTGVVIYLFNLYIKSDLKNVFRKLKRLWQVILFASIMQSIFIKGGNALITVFGINLVTTNGIEQGLVILLRFFSLICGAAAIASYNREYVTEGLIRYKVPYELSFTAVLGIGFLPKLSSEMRNSITAIKLRGVELEKLAFKKKIKVYSYILFPVVTSALLKAKDLSSSMQTRGFKALPKRTAVIELEFIKRDFVVATIVITFQLLAILWRLFI